MKKTTLIGEREVGPGLPLYLAIEVGTTCAGDMKKALALVDAAANAGADAVKFQVIDTEQISDPSVTHPVYVGGKIVQANMKDMFARLHFDEADWGKIAEHCAEESIDFFATVDSQQGIDMLERIGVPAYKVGAWDCTYRPLIEALARTGKPVIVDLGPTTNEELAAIVEWFSRAGGTDLVFLHDFHTADPAEFNLRAIQYLNESLPGPHGFSSPGLDSDIDFVALGLGACVIEKRLILDRNEFAFHAHESLEPQELVDWVRRIRRAEASLGTKEIRPSKPDRDQSQKFYRSVCTSRTVKKGEILTIENLTGKRPGTGTKTVELPAIWGRKASRDLEPDTLVTRADYE